VSTGSADDPPLGGSSYSEWKFVVDPRTQGQAAVLPGQGAVPRLQVLQQERVIEGLAIAAVAAGSHDGIFYIRHEYPNALKRVRAALAEMEKRGWLGERLLGMSGGRGGGTRRGSGTGCGTGIGRGSGCGSGGVGCFGVGGSGDTSGCTASSPATKSISSDGTAVRIRTYTRPGSPDKAPTPRCNRAVTTPSPVND